MISPCIDDAGMPPEDAGMRFSMALAGLLLLLGCEGGEGITTNPAGPTSDTGGAGGAQGGASSSASGSTSGTGGAGGAQGGASSSASGSTSGTGGAGGAQGGASSSTGSTSSAASGTTTASSSTSGSGGSGGGCEAACCGHLDGYQCGFGICYGGVCKPFTPVRCKVGTTDYQSCDGIGHPTLLITWGDGPTAGACLGNSHEIKYCPAGTYCGVSISGKYVGTGLCK